jgi:hypothetical protein
MSPPLYRCEKWEFPSLKVIEVGPLFDKKSDAMNWALSKGYCIAPEFHSELNKVIQERGCR